MAERRTISLLDCAIAASAAIVPVLLGVIALVAWVRPADPDGPWRQRHDRYVSVRHVAALKTFEDAVVARAPSRTAMPSAAEVLAAVPSCRREWRGDDGALHAVRRALLGEEHADAAPAAQVAAQLGELDAALLQFSTRANRRVEHRLGLDAQRWFASAAAALAAPLESADAPGQRFRLRCADLAGALAALRRNGGAVLDSFAWRGSESAATVARWHPDQEMRISAREVTRRNPWGGVPGCIYLGGDAAAPGYDVAPSGSVQQRVCALAAVRGSAAASATGAAPIAIAGEPGAATAIDDPRWMVPPSLLALLQPLESLRQPSGSLYRVFGESDEAPSSLGTPRDTVRGNQVRLDGTPLEVGYSIDVTIDPALQALAQKTAACYTGRHDVCRALAIRRAEDGDRPLGDQLLEGAMVRMAAIAVIDVASGRIEALAGAMSPCARQEVDGPGRDASCDSRLPYRVGYRADALLNPAVYHDAMPASTIKPIMASAFLADGDGRGARLLASERAAMQRDGTPARESLRGQLMRSDSARFLDRMFCGEQGFAACSRPWQVQAAARAFGWDAGCSDGDERCGKIDLLFGRTLAAADDRAALAPAPTAIAYGRLLSEPAGKKLGAPMHLMAPSALDAGILRRCAAGPDGRRFSDDDWEKCKGGAVVDVVAEGWGQGHARASVLGVAGMMATLAAAANGATRVPRPHLVAAVRGVAAAGQGAASDPVALASARWAGAPLPAPLPREAAEVILSGLSYSHRAGTARTACEQVFDAKRCREIDWLAGKTGTPSFPSDGLTLDALVHLCREGAAPSHEAQRGACSSLRPYKWYVAAWRGDGAKSGPWTKAIAVLTERNWLRASGRIHGTGDHGPNPSAEIAMQIVGRRSGAIEGAAP
jgi:cell division protein FtsI/penicillin-binding protein 2